MSTILRPVARGMMVAAAIASCFGLLSGSAVAQGVGLPGIGMPGIGSPAMNLPQRQGPMAGGGAGGVPGQMNPRMGGGFRPGQGVGMPAPSVGQSRGSAFIGTPRNAAGFSGMAAGGNVQGSSQNIIQGARNAGVNVPGYGGARRGNR